MSNRLLVVFSLLILLALTACNFTLAADVTPPPGYQAPSAVAPQSTLSALGPVYPPVPPNPADGEAIFAEKCAPCHGVSGLGDGPRAAQLPNPVPALGAAEVAAPATLAEWYSIVTQGNLERFMPPFGSLTERQRWDVVAYAFSLSMADESLARAAEIYQAECSGCHGISGQGDGSQVASLPSTPKDLTDLEYAAGKSVADIFTTISQGSSNGMPAYAEQLSEADRLAISQYLRSLSFAASERPSQAAANPEATPAPAEEPVEIAAAPGITTTTTVSPGTGSVFGTLTNGSDGAPPEGIEVSLHVFQDMTLIYSDTTTTQAGGIYRFDDLEMPAGRVFFATTEFQDMIYNSEPVEVEAGQVEVELPIQVYEATTDPANVTIDRLHLFLEMVDEGTLRVSELYILSNLSARTLIAPEDGQAVLTYDLPEGAANLQFQEGVSPDRFIKTEEGFGDLRPVEPGIGNYQLLYSYELPYTRKVELSHRVNLPAKAILVALPEDGVKVKGDTLVDAGTMEGQGASFHIYNGSALESGQLLNMTISGRPFSASGSSSNLIIGIGAFGLVLVIGGLWLYQRGKSRAAEEAGASSITEPNGHSSDNPDTLMDAILALDDLYKEGNLPEEAYLHRRAELKARLKDLLDQGAS